MHFDNFESYAAARDAATVISVMVETNDGSREIFRLPSEAHDQLVDDIAAFASDKSVITFWDRHTSSVVVYSFHAIKKISVSYQSS